MEVESICGMAAGEGTSGDVREAFGSCATGSVTSCAESTHGKSSRNAKESANGCFKVFLLIETGKNPKYVI